jgi:hypothetical protein
VSGHFKLGHGGHDGHDNSGCGSMVFFILKM